MVDDSFKERINLSLMNLTYCNFASDKRLFISMKNLIVFNFFKLR